MQPNPSVTGAVDLDHSRPLATLPAEKGVSSTVAVLQELERNASLGKYTHFTAARRKRVLGSLVGIPVIVINLLIGSLLFVLLNQEVPSAGKWAGAFLSLVAAALSGVQTFFGFQRQFEGHNRAGNRYLHFSRKCQHLLAAASDGVITLEDLRGRIETLEKEYTQLNTDAEPYPTAPRDFVTALKLEQQRQAGLQRRYGNNTQIDSEESIGAAEEAFRTQRRKTK